MDPERYKNKTEYVDTSSLQQSEQKEFTPEIRMLRKDILDGKVIWYDNIFKDFGLYLANYHILFSCIFASKYNPYSKNERRFVLFTTLLLSFSLSTIDSTDVLSKVGGLIVAVTAYIMKLTATCSCVQDQAVWIKDAGEFLGKAIMGIVFVGTFFFAIISILDVVDEDNDDLLKMLYRFLTIQATGWGWALLPNIVYFLFYRSIEKYSDNKHEKTRNKDLKNLRIDSI